MNRVTNLHERLGQINNSNSHQGAPGEGNAHPALSQPTRPLDSWKPQGLSQEPPEFLRQPYVSTAESHSQASLANTYPAYSGSSHQVHGAGAHQAHSAGAHQAPSGSTVPTLLTKQSLSQTTFAEHYLSKTKSVPVSSLVGPSGTSQGLYDNATGRVSDLTDVTPRLSGSTAGGYAPLSRSSTSPRAHSMEYSRQTSSGFTTTLTSDPSSHNPDLAHQVRSHVPGAEGLIRTAPAGLNGFHAEGGADTYVRASGLDLGNVVMSSMSRTSHSNRSSLNSNGKFDLHMYFMIASFEFF